MTTKGMDRRRFLHASGIGIAAAVGTVPVLGRASKAWALSLDTLDAHTGETLVGVARQMYPHDALADLYYARVVEALDGKAAGDAALAKTLTDGVAKLDAVYDVPWLALSDGYRGKALATLADTGFFQTVRGTVVTTFYNDKQVWRFFGYEGSSYEYGGYINRGFNDLGWLPDVS